MSAADDYLALTRRVVETALGLEDAEDETVAWSVLTTSSGVRFDLTWFVMGEPWVAHRAFSIDDHTAPYQPHQVASELRHIFLGLSLEKAARAEAKRWAS